MTIGEHLGELRGCVVRSLVALVLVCIPCFWLARPLLAIIARPMVLAMRHHGQNPNFLQTAPLEAFLVYIKVALLSGVILASPYILYQIWSFVASGLYAHERRWALRLVPVSVLLFMLGVVFMYVFVLLLSLNFLIGFSSWLSLPDLQPTALERTLLGEPPPAQIDQAPTSAPAVAVLAADPEEPPIGAWWFNLRDGKLKLRAPDGVYSVVLGRTAGNALLSAHFKISEYLTFVLTLTIAFGAAFQTPLVVVFLVRTGIVPLATLQAYRKVVILTIVIIAGVIAPPDLLSHVLLSIPMYALFEVGMLLARGKGRVRA